MGFFLVSNSFKEAFLFSLIHGLFPMHNLVLFLFEELILWYYLIIIIREYFWWTDSYYEKCTIENLMREKNQSCITGITKKDLSLISRSTLLFSDKSKWEEIQIYSFELKFLTLNRELPAMKCSIKCKTIVNEYTHYL